MAGKIKSQINKFFRYAVIITLSSFMLFYYALSSIEITCTKSTPFVIPHGAGLNKVISILEDTKCFKKGKVFKWFMFMSRQDRNIRPGKYDLNDATNINGLMKLITTEVMDYTNVTILEGWTIVETARRLSEVIKIDSTIFIALCYDIDFIYDQGVRSRTLEGYLYPDTYSFLSSRISVDIKEEEVIERMVEEFFKNYKKSVGLRNKNVKLTVHEVVTLASIIQGECIYEDEMPRVSSVYTNRLRKNWLLQADPTIQYLKPGKNKRLYNKDYHRFDSPYNTYKYKGLPPGPISSPGIAAIIAAAFPEETDYMFFVAKGDGNHYFSKSENEHNRAKKKYLKEVW